MQVKEEKFQIEFWDYIFRFSIGWSRVLPEVVGENNQARIDYYNNLINALLESEIMPAVTLLGPVPGPGVEGRLAER